MENNFEISSLALPGIEQLWTESLGSPDICIAVLDGPVDLSHPCFEGANLTQIETLVSGEADKREASQHGTHISSIIFGQHAGPVKGVAPACRGLIVPIFSNRPDGRLTSCSQIDLARAITQSVNNGAHIINISGGELASSAETHYLLTKAVQLCADKGVLIVAAAGNNGCQCLNIPAAMSSALAVGAMDSQGSPLAFSNWDESYQSHGILAPGENIAGAAPGGGIASRSGTSYATPIISGIVALLASIRLKYVRNIDFCKVRDSIINSAISCDEQPISDCRRLLAGRLNIVGALTHIMEGEKMETSDQNKNNQVEADNTAKPANVDDDLKASFEQPTVVAQAAESNATTEEVIAKDVSPPKVNQIEELESAVTVEPSEVTPSKCACGGGAQSSPIFVLGQISYDFGTEARRDSFTQQGVSNPYDPIEMLEYLEQYSSAATGIIWTLTQESTPIYAIKPEGPFAIQVYERLWTFLLEQVKEGVELISIPGWESGKVSLMNGQVVPTICPELRGMYSWSTKALIEACIGKPPAKKENQKKYEQESDEIRNFLDRIYYELRNLGLTPQDRAMNYSATNAFQVGYIYKNIVNEKMKLDNIGVELSPICRPNSECWDVKLTFFNPAKRLEQAREVYRFTVDVSDIVPVTVGKVRHWYIY